MTANEDDAVQVIADALHKDANAREGDAADYAFWAAAALRAAGLLPGPDDIVVSREDLQHVYEVSFHDGCPDLYCSRCLAVIAALSQPHPAQEQQT